MIQVTMKVIHSCIFILLTRGALAGDCNAAQECVWVMDGEDNVLASYVPTCNGNCYQYSTFYQTHLWKGDGPHTVSCIIYRDSQCHEELQTVGDGNTYLNSAANGMICFYDC